MVSFINLKFDPKEYNIPDNMLMLGKQFKILNNKLNSSLQIHADTGGQKFVSGVEVEFMLKSQENWLKLAMEEIEKQYEDLLKNHACIFNTRLQSFVMLQKSVMRFLLSKSRSWKNWSI